MQVCHLSNYSDAAVSQAQFAARGGLAFRFIALVVAADSQL